MILLVLLSLLLVPYFALIGYERCRHQTPFDPTLKFRAGATLLFLFTGVGHFVRTEEMALMLGEFSGDPILVIQITGVLELLGAIVIWFARWKKFTGQCLIAMLIAFLPLNIYAAIQYVPFGGHEHGPIYLLVRIPFQFLLIWWIAKATRATPGRLVHPLRTPSTSSPAS